MLLDVLAPGCLWDAPGRVFLFGDRGFQGDAYGIIREGGHVRVSHQHGCLGITHFDERGCILVDLARVGDGTLAASLPALMGCRIQDRKNKAALRDLLRLHGLELVTIHGEALITVRLGDEEFLIATQNCD